MEFVKMKGEFSINEVSAIGAFVSRKNFSEEAIESFERNRDISVIIKEDKILFTKIFDKKEDE